MAPARARSTWGLGLAADVVERGGASRSSSSAIVLRRALAVVLVFHYVCLAWIFFRATLVRQRARRAAPDRAAREPITRTSGRSCTIALVVGFLAHFFADGSFRWLRDRFVALPAWAQGLVLAAVALVLRELGHAKIVPFIYFQF